MLSYQLPFFLGAQAVGERGRAPRRYRSAAPEFHQEEDDPEPVVHSAGPISPRAADQDEESDVVSQPPHSDMHVLPLDIAVCRRARTCVSVQQTSMSALTRTCMSYQWTTLSLHVGAET